MYREGVFTSASEAAVGTGLDVLTEEQAVLANSLMETMIQNDLTQVVRNQAVNDRIFLLALKRMDENNLREQIKQAIRILARMAEEMDAYMPCTLEDKELLEKLLFPEQDGRYILLITTIIRKCLIGGKPVRGASKLKL